MSAPTPSMPTPHELRRYHAGELSTARRAEIEAAAAADASLRARLDDLAADDAAFRASMPFERFVADHDARVLAVSPLRRLVAAVRNFKVAGAGALVAAAAALVVVVRMSGPATADDAVDANRVKGSEGGAGIGFLVDERDAVRVGHSGDLFRQGDRIQFAVREPFADARAMVVVGVDGKCAVTVYAAESLAPSREKGGKARVLDSSVVLDDAVGAERFFVVFADADVAALQRDVEAAAKKLAGARADLTTTERLPLDDGRAVQSSVHIVKVAP